MTQQDVANMVSEYLVRKTIKQTAGCLFFFLRFLRRSAISCRDRRDIIGRRREALGAVPVQQHVEPWRDLEALGLGRTSAGHQRRARRLGPRRNGRLAGRSLRRG